MKKRSRMICILTTVLFILSSLSAHALSTPAIPTLIDVNPLGAEGDWYTGAIPPNCDTAKPVIVFVQGLHGKASNWWGATKYYGNNDMYAYAYSSGYRTAFVNFIDADGPGGDMWRNGSVLSRQLQQICSYYNVKKVNLVCHSKGGVDAQCAIVYYGANLYVDKVFTLSSPHWGSQAANLAYSWYAGWLAELLGQKDSGTYCLQTGYMSDYRSLTDNLAANTSVAYYTAAGTNWGPFFSQLWIGGLYLSTYGDNDGLVTVNNAKLPYGIHVATKNLNHDSIRIGSNVWSFVEPKIRTLSTTSVVASATSVSSASGAAKEAISPSIMFAPPSSPDSGSNYLLRGGPIEKSETTTIPVESNVNSVVFDLLVANPEVNAKIISPDGAEYTPTQTIQDNEYFNGATHLLTNINKPKSGVWKLSIKAKKKAKKKNAYLLVTSYDSSLNSSIIPEKKLNKNGKTINVNVGLKNNQERNFKLAKGKVKLFKPTKSKNSKGIYNQDLQSFDKKLSSDITISPEPGLYNFNISVEGTLSDGSPFERTLIQSEMVGSNTPDDVGLLITDIDKQNQ